MIPWSLAIYPTHSVVVVFSRFSKQSGLRTWMGSRASTRECRDSVEAIGIMPHAHESMGAGTGAVWKVKVNGSSVYFYYYYYYWYLRSSGSHVGSVSVLCSPSSRATNSSWKREKMFERSL